MFPRNALSVSAIAGVVRRDEPSRSVSQSVPGSSIGKVHALKEKKKKKTGRGGGGGGGGGQQLSTRCKVCVLSHGEQHLAAHGGNLKGVEHQKLMKVI